MGVTQYVGARYVPHGWTDWNAETSYDALYVVKYNLAWYIAKKPVPVGAKPTCEKYWALTDNWNGQVEEYRKEVVAVNERVTALRTDISNLQSDINVTNANVSENLSKINDRLTGKKFVMIGDSFARDGWPQMIVNRLKLNQNDYVILFSPGGGWNSQGTIQKTFIDLLHDASGLIDPNEVDYVITIGGTNDVHKNLSTDYYDVIENYCNYATSTFKNAKNIVGFVATLYREEDYVLTSGTSRHGMIAFAKSAVIRGCQLSGQTIFIDRLSENIANLFRYISSDFIHPTTSGYNILTDSIMSAINGNVVNEITAYSINNVSFNNEGWSGNIYYEKNGSYSAIVISASYSGEEITFNNHWLKINVGDIVYPNYPSTDIYEQCMLAYNTTFLPGMIKFNREGVFLANTNAEITTTNLRLWVPKRIIIGY